MEFRQLLAFLLLTMVWPLLALKDEEEKVNSCHLTNFYTDVTSHTNVGSLQLYTILDVKFRFFQRGCTARMGYLLSES